MGKLKKKSLEKKGKNDDASDYANEVEINTNESKIGRSILVKNDHSGSKKKDGLISRVRFKTKPESNKILKPKTHDAVKKEKYEAIKDDILKKVKHDQDQDAKIEKEELNFVKKQPINRVTNAVIKSILKSKNPQDAGKLAKSKLGGQSFPKVEKQIKKRDKLTLKKEIWNKKIDMIKSEVKESAEKAKREKTVITGDIKPIIESLQSVETPTVHFAKDEKVKVEAQSLSKRQQNELNKERQQSKAIQRESIRNKKAKDDVSLFGQLLGYSEFVQNPLETLKKIK